MVARRISLVLKVYELLTYQSLAELTPGPIRDRAHQTVETENLGKRSSKP
jgi:hypothetical protein